MKTSMNIRRQVFLNKHCPACGGKIFRYLLGQVTPNGDGGDQVFQTQIIDCCTGTCEHVFNETSVANWPLLGLETIFDQWTTGDLPHQDFDTRITNLLKRANISWKQTDAG